MRTAYLAPEELIEPARRELKRVEHVFGQLIVAGGPPQPSSWAQNIWFEPVELTVGSIADAAKQLKALQRNWAVYSFHLHRRAKLIQAALPHVSSKPLVFPAPPPKAPLGSWTLLEPSRILAAPRCSSPFPNGEAVFAENHRDPPSRAYLKLWEALTRCGEHPERGARCLDAGASPGGWTWVLAELGAEVLAVDRAPLAPRVVRRKNVTFEKGDAFRATPDRLGAFDWVLSDVACYPEKLLAWVRTWIGAGAARRMICTVKFQGTARYGAVREFAKIESSELVHLSHNKHELTWIYRQP